MQRPVCFVYHMLCSTSDNDSYSFGILRVSNIDELVISYLDFFNDLCFSEAILRQFLDTRQYSSPGCLGEFLHVTGTNVLDGGNSFLG